MASEKGDLPQDTDSLPPNYASSEVFTDSPPPAYRKTNTVRLQITRVVCFTILAIGFLTGAFILAHTWISTRNGCDCDQAPNLPPQSASLIASSPVVRLMEDNVVVDSEDSQLAMEPPQVDTAQLDSAQVDMSQLDMSQLDQESRQMDIPLPDEDEDRLQLAQEAMEDEAEGIQSLVEEEEKRVKLPVDLLFGNPALAGKNVQCKVQKKMQNLGAGILSKTIIVTCDDDSDDEQQITNPFAALLGARPSPQPPMSLLAPILKMMAARANARLQRQMQPKLAMRRFPQPMMQPIGISMSGPMPQSFNGPYPVPFDGNGPFPGHPLMGMPGPMRNGPPQGVFNGPMPMPGNSIMHPNMAPPMHFLSPESEQHNHHHHHHHHHMEEPDMPFVENQNMPFEEIDNIDYDDRQNMPFRENFDNEEEPQRPFILDHAPNFRPFPPQENQPQEISEIKHPSNVRVFHGFPPQIPEAIKQIVSHIMKTSGNREGRGKSPVIAIKAFPEMRTIESNEGPQTSRMLLPFPFRAIKIQTRGGRMLGFNEDESFNGAPFPLPRGAISAGLKPLIVPDPAGRALDSPVTIPSPQEIPSLRFFPGRVLRLPVPLQGRAITHMEMKQNPNSIIINEENIQPTEEEERPELSVNDHEGHFASNGPDFGPPRMHTVIRGPAPIQEQIIHQEIPVLQEAPAIQVQGALQVVSPMLDNITDESNPILPFLRRFPPPPPKFAREGRSGLVTEINPDAEMIIPAANREHHIIMVN